MNRIRFEYCAASAVCSLVLASATSAGIVAYYEDPDGWMKDAGAFTTIDFNLGSPQILTDQYAALGILFTGGDDVAVPGSPFSFEDGWGLKPNGGSLPLIEIAFTEPQTAFMIKYPAVMGFTLYSDGVPLWSGGTGGQGPNWLGVISSVPFDSVHLTSTLGSLAVDDLFFASSVPSPGGLAVLLTAFATGRGRRRR